LCFTFTFVIFEDDGSGEIGLGHHQHQQLEPRVVLLTTAKHGATTEDVTASSLLSFDNHGESNIGRAGHEDERPYFDEDHPPCYFTRMVSYSYLAFMYFFAILIPGVMMAYFYIHIFVVVYKKVQLYFKQISILKNKESLSKNNSLDIRYLKTTLSKANQNNVYQLLGSWTIDVKTIVFRSPQVG
jgi:hypothetical protein